MSTTRRTPTKKTKRRSPKHVKAGKQAHQVHRVKASVNLQDLPQAGAAITLKILHDQTTLGHLVIGRGSLTWWGKNRRTNYVSFSWPEFAAAMEKHLA